MTSFIVCRFCSLFSSLFNGKLFRMNSKFNKKTSRKLFYTRQGLTDSSLFTQEYAKELFEAQGNIIYKDISQKSKAPQDLICMASVLGKLKTNLCYLRNENHAMDTYAIQWRTAKCLPVRKFFLVLLSTVVSKIQFFCAGCYFKNQRFTELQGPVFTKETLKN